jgi:pilus assembly protein CpaE
MTEAQRVQTIILTTPNDTDQDWMWRLEMVRELEVVGRLTEVEAALQTISQTRPELVMVNQEASTAAASISRIRSIAPETICIAIVQTVDLDTMRELMAVGARDVLTPDMRTTELLSSLREIRQMEAERKSTSRLALQPRVRGKLVVLVAPKGGVGTTTIATNLAIGLRSITGRPTVLADFSLQFGDVGTHLNLPTSSSIADIASSEEHPEGGTLSQLVSHHSSGLHVLGAPSDPKLAAQITGAEVRAAVDVLLDNYSYVVADTWSFLDEVTETLLSCADEVLLIATPELPTLRNAKHLIDVIRRRSLLTQPLKLVLNRYPSVEGISKEDVADNLGCSISMSIPSDGSLMTYSVNAGIPAVVSHPESWVAKSIMLLAQMVAGDDTNAGRTTNAAKAAREAEKGHRGLRHRMGIGA